MVIYIFVNICNILSFILIILYKSKKIYRAYIASLGGLIFDTQIISAKVNCERNSRQNGLQFLT